MWIHMLVCVLPTVLSERCSVRQDGEKDLSLLGHRMELVESLIIGSYKDPPHLRDHQGSYKPEHQTQLQLQFGELVTGEFSCSYQGLNYKLL